MRYTCKNNNLLKQSETDLTAEDCFRSYLQILSFGENKTKVIWCFRKCSRRSHPLVFSHKNKLATKIFNYLKRSRKLRQWLFMTSSSCERQVPERKTIIEENVIN